MDINTIITINNQDYLLTQKVQYNNTYYYMAIAVDAKYKLLKKYGIFKEIVQDGKVFFDIVRDNKEKKAVYELLVKDFNSDVLKDKAMMPVGQMVAMNGKEYALLDYIPFENKIYMVFSTITKPCDILVCLRGLDKEGKIHLYDVTTQDEGIKVLQIFANINNKK